MKYKKRIFYRETFITTTVIIVLLVTLIPLVWFFLFSINAFPQAFDIKSFRKISPTFQNYLDVFRTYPFGRYFFNSFSVAISASIITMIIGVPAAFALSQLRSRLKSLSLVYTILARMVPPMVFVIPYFLLFQRLNLINTLPGLIIAYINLNVPLVVWFMWGFFNEVPQDLLEAARIDGASIFQAFRKVFLPLSTPGLSTTAINSFLMAWNEFLFALILTRGETKTAPVGIVDLIAYEGVNWEFVSSGSILLLLPTLLFAYLTRKYMVRGLLGGATKG